MLHRTRRKTQFSLTMTSTKLNMCGHMITHILLDEIKDGGGLKVTHQSCVDILLWMV